MREEKEEAVEKKQEKKEEISFESGGKFNYESRYGVYHILLRWGWNKLRKQESC